MGGQGGIDAVGDDRAGELGEFVVADEVIGEAHRDGVACGERCARQRGVKAEQPGCTRQDVRAADVGDEPDTHLGHRHLRGVGDDADAAVGADADAATHHDAVHQRHERLRVPRDVSVHPVLVPPERAGHVVVAASAVVDLDDVAAGAQAALACAGEHSGADGVVVAPFGQCPRDRGDHRVGE